MRTVVAALGVVALVAGCSNGGDGETRRCERALSRTDLPLPEGRPLYFEPSADRWTCTWGATEPPRAILIVRTFASDAEGAAFFANDRAGFELPEVSEPNAFATAIDDETGTAVLAVGRSVLSLDLVGVDLPAIAALRVLQTRAERILRL